MAGALAKAEGTDDAMVRNAQCAGILSHLGSILLMVYHPITFHKAGMVCEKEKSTIYEAEIKILGVGHAELGAYLLGFWGFANPIVEAVAYHHSPGECDNTRLSALTFVHAAQYLCSRRHIQGKDTKLSPYLLDSNYLEQVGVSLRQADWKNIAETILQKEVHHE